MKIFKKKFYLIFSLLITIAILIFSYHIIESNQSEIGQSDDDTNLQENDENKLPYQYTYEEFVALEEEEKERFINWFSTYDEFLQWEKHQLIIKLDEQLPWTNGGKMPSQYSYLEFEALTDEEKQEFYNWFISHDAYLKWEATASETSSYGEYPWENGGKLPNQYTYLEFESLTSKQKEAFYEWFLSHEDYLEWESNAE